MRIGVDAACWPNRRGYGRFTRGILTALARDPAIELTFLADSETARDLVPPPGVRLTVVPSSVAAGEAASASGSRPLRDLLRLGRAAANGRFDLVFFPSVYSYFPVLGRTPQIVTIHDAIPETVPDLVFPARRLRLFWQLKVGWAIRAARRIVTVSPFAARQIQDRLGVGRDRLRVVSEAADPAFQPVPPEVRDPILARYLLVPYRYLLFVGGLSPHKDLPTLLRAFAALAPAAPDLVLALAGDVERDSFYTEPKVLAALAAKLGIADRLRWLGYVSDEDLAAVYSGATALVLPSLAEGFGLPAIEAAACACPVIASDQSGADELLGDAVGLFPARDANRLAASIRSLLDDPAEHTRRGALLRERARSYTWEHAAAALGNVFREVAPGRLTRAIDPGGSRLNVEG